MASAVVSTRHKEILEAAAELFYSRSFAAVGMDAIGERAGVTGPAIYRHFSGKNEILATLFDEAIDGLVLATAQTFDDPWQELEYLIRGHTSFVISQRKLAGVKIREERSVAGPARKRLHARERRYVERWTTCIGRCLPHLSVDEQVSISHATIGAMNSVASWPPAALHTVDVPGLMVEMLGHGVAAFTP